MNKLIILLESSVQTMTPKNKKKMMKKMMMVIVKEQMQKWVENVLTIKIGKMMLKLLEKMKAMMMKKKLMQNMMRNPLSLLHFLKRKKVK